MISSILNQFSISKINFTTHPEYNLCSLIYNNEEVVFCNTMELLSNYVVKMSEVKKDWLKQKELNIKFNLLGTDFQKKVWAEVSKIPFGQTRTYSDIAQNINQPTAARAVASAISKNPILIHVPCHRVIGKNGSLRGYSGGLKLKKLLLDLELKEADTK